MVDSMSVTRVAQAGVCDYAQVAQAIPGVIPPEPVIDSTAQRAAELGEQYEQEILNSYRTGGGLCASLDMAQEPRNILNYGDLNEDRSPHDLWIGATELAALLNGDYDVIYQLPVSADGMHGVIDFLVRVDGQWRIQDAKLAREGSALAALQVGGYWRILDRLLSELPANERPTLDSRGDILTGNGRRVDVKAAEISYVIPTFLKHLHDLAEVQATDPIELWRLDKLKACETCEWCTQAIEATQDLKLIASIHPQHRKKLREAGYTSIDDVASIDPKASDLGITALERLVRQARMQVGQRNRSETLSDDDKARDRVPIEWEIFDTSPIERLPYATDHDIYFDFERRPALLSFWWT